jgi:hypothetical protein
MLSITLQGVFVVTEPDILQVGPYPDWDQKPLDEAFVMHRLFEADDKPGFLANRGPSIRAIATRGELGPTGK